MMDNKVLIQVNGFELTPAIEARVKKAVKNIFKVDQTVDRVEVFLELQKRKDDNGCWVTISVARTGKNVIVKEEGTNLYECIGKAGESATRATRHEKEKVLDKDKGR